MLREGESRKATLRAKRASGQGLYIRNQLPAHGFGKAAPGGHAVLQAAIRENPEKLSRAGFLYTIGVQIGTVVFAVNLALGLFSMARGAMLGKHFCSGLGRVGIASKRIRPITILGRNFVQPVT